MAAFTKGDIIVYRVGTGTGTLSSSAAAVFLDEYNPITGALVNTIALPTADSGSNQTLTQSGSATSAGLLTRSEDGRYLVFSGYDAAVGTASVTGTTSASINRIVARVDAAGNVDTSTRITTAFNADNVRGVASVDGTAFYVAGNGSSTATSGVRYVTLGANGGETNIATGNDRAIDIYNGQLYIDASATISTVGSGTPTTSATTASLGLALSNANEFVFLDRDGTPGVDTLYVAQDASIAKFALINGTWTAEGTIATGMRGLDGVVSGTSAVFYGTTTTTTANSIVAFTDTAAWNATISATVTTIATAGANTVFRGLALAPGLLDIGFSSGAVSHSEGTGSNTTYTFVINRESGTASATVGYVVTGSGTNPADAADFGGTLPSGTATFTGTNLSTTITITVTGDSTPEPDEQFTVTLTNPSTGYQLGAVSSQIGTIVNDDTAAPGSFSLAGAQSASEAAGSITFTINRTGGSAGAATLSYSVAGSGTNPADANDFGGTLPSGTVNFADGQTSATITIPVSNDSTVEPDETFTLTIANASIGTIGTATATGTIVNDDVTDTTPPTLSSSSPVDNATDVAIGANIVLNFSETVKANSGSIILRPATGSDVTIAVGDTTQVTFNGSQVTINPTADLRTGVAYDVIIASGVITDSAGNAFAGIATDALDFTTSFTIPSGTASDSYTTTFAITDPGTFTLLGGGVRTQTSGTAVNATVASGSTTIDIEGQLKDTAAKQVAIAATLAGGAVTVGANGVVQSLNADAIDSLSANGTVNLTNLGQILATSAAFTPAAGGTNPGTEFAISYNAAKGASGAGATDYTSGGTITNGSTTNSAALIRSDNGDAIRLGSHETLTNYGTINGAGPINDASTNNSFNNTSTATTYDISRGVRLNQSGETAVKIENYGTIVGAQHGVDMGQTNITNVVVDNYAGGLILGHNGSGVGSDASGAAANNVTVNNYGTIRGEYAPAYDRAGLATIDGDGDGVDIDGGATINNFAGGVIQGGGTATDPTVRGAGGYDSGGRANASEGISIGGGVITNAGTITGVDAAIVVNNDGNTDGSRSGTTATTITNYAGGAITGEAGYAIRLENKTSAGIDTDTITNYGTITGNGAIPTGTVTLEDGSADPRTIGTLDGVTYTAADAGNARFIKGDGAAIQMGEGNDTLSNYGAITGNVSGRAINLEGGDDTLTLYTGETITGRIDGGAGNDTLVLALDNRPTSGATATTGNNSGATAGSISQLVNIETLSVTGGSWALTDAASFSGGITIAANSALILATGAGLTGAITDNGVLGISSTGAVNVAGAISGSGAVLMGGTGVVTLANAANSYSGGTSIAQGTVEIATAGAAGTGAIVFANSAAAQVLQIDAAALSSGAFANAITGLAADGDTIDVRGIGLATTSYNASTGVLTLTGTTGNATLTVGTGYGSYLFNAAADGATGADAGTKVSLASATPPSLSVSNVSVVEGNSGTTNLVFTVTASSAAPAGGISFTAATSDGTATTADNDYTAINGTYTIAPGATSTTVTVPVIGDLRVEANETLTLTLSSPQNATIATATATGTITNDDVVPTLSIANVTVTEGNSGTSTAHFTVQLSNAAPAGGVTFDIATADGTAAAGSDYIGQALTSQTIAAGASSYSFDVTINGDTTYEADETFGVNVTNIVGATNTSAAATGTIANDDLVKLSVSNATVTEGNSGTSILHFTVTTDQPAPTGGVSFTVATADGTATAASGDYVAKTATGTIAAGQTSYSFDVVVNGDTTYEHDETVLVNISAPVNATIANAQGTGTIVNDDSLPTSVHLFDTNFAAFTAAGFAPGATAASGQLDSNIWRVTKMSDNLNPAYGFTGAGGSDFGRGVINGAAATSTGGIYSPSADHALVIRPTGADFDNAGFIEGRFQNTSGANVTSFALSFDWAYRNSGDRADSLTLSYSTDGVNFVTVPAAALTTPSTRDATTAATFTDAHETVTLSDLLVADGGYLYIRWNHPSSVNGLSPTGGTGNGNRDEVGIDNVSLDATGLTTAPALTVSGVSQAEGNSGDTAFTFTLHRTSSTGVASVAYHTTDGTASSVTDYAATSGTVTFADGETDKTVTVLVHGDTARESDETFYLDLTNASGFALPNPRAIATITNDDTTGPVSIPTIQGLGHTSPFAGQSVSTSGVITAFDANGFYLQDPVGDGDANTSDAIYVFVGSGSTATTSYAVGNAITLTGTVSEFTQSTGGLTITELTSPSAITVINPSATLPAATVIATDGVPGHRAPPTDIVDNDGLTSYQPNEDAIDFYESLEGMLVTYQTPLVVSNTNSSHQTYIVASDGAGSTLLNDRDGLTISATDGAPERIELYESSAATNAHTQGDVLNNVTGILTYYGGEYELVPTAAVTTQTDNPQPARETTGLVGDATHLSYASFNVENLGPIATHVAGETDAAYAAKQAVVDAHFAALATEVTAALKNPDIIGLQEIQDSNGENANDGNVGLSGAATAQKLIDAIAAAGGPTYVYAEVAPTTTNTNGGAPNGNIRNGFLYNPDRVSLVPNTVHLLNDSAYAGSRYPLVADFTFNGQTFTAIDVHSYSRGGSDPEFGIDQPAVQSGDAKRTAEAQPIANLINSTVASDPNHLFIVNGDFNGYPYETALQSIIASGAVKNLYDTLPAAEQYSYYFDGYYQAFDNIIVSQSLYGGSTFDVVHYNAGYNDGLSYTDHDQAVALISIARAATATVAANADNATISAGSSLGLNLLANDTGATGLAITSLTGASGTGSQITTADGAIVTLHADGTVTYDTNGAFSDVASGSFRTDQFTYTLNQGTGAAATGTVTITVNGTTTPAAVNGKIVGTSGNDNYSGTTAGDYFDLSGGGNDSVSGGAGDDAFYFGAALTGADHVSGGAGDNDQVAIEGNYSGTTKLVLGPDTFSNVELLAMLPGGSTPHQYDVTWNDGNLAAGQIFYVYGGQLAANESLTFNGSSETDGSFVMLGGYGTDNLTGGAGNDGFYFGVGKWNSTDVVHGGGGDNDQIGLDGDYTIIADSRMDVEVLALLPGTTSAPNHYNITVDDSFAAAGETKYIYAGKTFTGVTINGAGEHDGLLNIIGGSGDDTIIGSTGNDFIFGGLGADTLTGGAGADVFYYDNAAQSSGAGKIDTLADFDYSADKIQIHGGTASHSYASVTAQLNSGSFDADLANAVGAQLTTGQAVYVTGAAGSDLAGQVFLVVEGGAGHAGYQSGEDYVFHMPAAPTVANDIIIA